MIAKPAKKREPRPTIGLALIARNEEHGLPRLLDSITGAFDEIALVDTGSTDDTVAIFEAWCECAGQNAVIDHFEWVDDFSAARNHSQSLLSTDWIAWADADDTIPRGRRPAPSRRD